MSDSLLGPAQIRSLADALGVRPTKTLGQNFVHDANSIRRIVNTAALEPGERVLEIGPGLGSLTLGLLDAGHPVTAVEVDPVLATALESTVRARLPHADLAVLHADALRLRDLPAGLAPPTAVVANLPYNVAVPVLLHVLATLPSLARGLVLVQAEVADRLAAAPGSRTYGVPSVKVAWYASAHRAGPVPRAVFWPVPNVDSGLVRLIRHAAPATTATRVQVFAVIDAAFAQRRKTLRAALAGWAGSAAAAETALRIAGIDPATRGEALDVASFARIAEAKPGLIN
ncbi:16S rRNA (adenine(1518)-N(6)/adenine(1519)-N(6))-dimethyltransferase RsmA [uncultured Jatrophihabitans sp.]|uniref:16S rRNA (adenine(1518)-N(6)/adenine(1519)-N(6))- dimethyltransferase RsmA n=1 Tax=uncultured Jatrophihabitans sp. TaxID=1610747 RepID=UPI0035C95109